MLVLIQVFGDLVGVR